MTLDALIERLTEKRDRLGSGKLEVVITEAPRREDSSSSIESIYLAHDCLVLSSDDRDDE